MLQQRNGEVWQRVEDIRLLDYVLVAVCSVFLAFLQCCYIECHWIWLDSQQSSFSFPVGFGAQIVIQVNQNFETKRCLKNYNDLVKAFKLVPLKVFRVSGFWTFHSRIVHLDSFCMFVLCIFRAFLCVTWQSTRKPCLFSTPMESFSTLCTEILFSLMNLF